ncbi:MAG: SprT family zinc-dependent metalloprotease [bacterium]|jgi:predicted metal-dependent hydrolase
MQKISTVIGQCFLKRTKRHTLAISVLPNGAVEVVAPLGAGVPEIQDKIRKRSLWIMRQRRHFLALRVERPARRYCTGATHRYLGRQYRLKISLAAKPDVKLRGGYLHISLPSNTSIAVSVLLSGWMRVKAKEQFERRLLKWRAWCVTRGLPEPKLHLLDMPKRWGSTHSDGRMYLNPELVRAPVPCIDYVIVHEVCHIKHPRHDKEFYAELEKLSPGWRAIKQRLETSEL